MGIVYFFPETEKAYAASHTGSVNYKNLPVLRDELEALLYKTHENRYDQSEESLSGQ